MKDNEIPVEDRKWLHSRTRLELKKRAGELAEPEQILGPLQTGTWGIIAAPPGVGKSMFALKLAWHMAWGKDLDHWECKKKRQVLLIDAEMSPRELSGRLDSFGEWPESGFFIHDTDNADQHLQEYFALSSLLSHERLVREARDINADVVIVDNIEYTLDPVRPGELYSPETWAQVTPLLNWAVMNNKLLILIDHTNAAGGVQGTLSKQRGARFIMQLEKLETDADLAFVSKFTKLRYLVEQELRGELRWSVYAGQWEVNKQMTIKEMAREIVLDYGGDAKALQEGLDVSRSHAYQLYKEIKGRKR